MKLPAYPRTKPSGVEWLGDLPEHWEVKRLKFAARTIMGQSPSSELYTDDPDERPFLQGNAEFGERFPSAKWFCNAAPKRVPSGALLLSVRAPVGALNEADKPYAIGRGLCAVVDNSTGIEKDFAWYVLQLTRIELHTKATGSTYDAVSAADVGNVQLSLPDPAEQRAIAAFLDRETGRVDRWVAKKRELIERLKEKRTALISRTVTRGLPPTAARAAGLPDNPPLKPSGLDWLDDVPAHWKVLPLKRVAQISYGVGGEIDRSLEEGLRTLSLPNVDFEGNLNLDDVPYAEVSEKEKREVLLRKGDLLFNWRNGSSDHLGKTAYFDADGEYSHVSFLLRIRLNPVKHCSKFFRYLLGGYRVTGFFKHSKAGVNNTFNLSELSALPVMFPPLPEQAAIAAYLDEETAKLDALVGKVEEAVERLQEYRTALITAAVTGKIDVREVKQ